MTNEITFRPLDHIARINGAIGRDLPTRVEDWSTARNGRIFEGDVPSDAPCEQALREYQRRFEWSWPKRPLFFFSDLHADATAFKKSLVASGGVEETGEGFCDFALTETGQRSDFVIGGDLFDKGPCNLDLLRVLKKLMDLGAAVDILAGNHDVRTYIGMQYMGAKSIETAHLFTRMGGKTMTLFKEVYDAYVKNTEADTCPMSEEMLRAYLFPDETWFSTFPDFAKDMIHAVKLEKEMKRIREKIGEIEKKSLKNGMTLANVYAAVVKCRALFLSPEGEFSWVFQRMTLAKRAGSFLFVHGGVDDTIVEPVLTMETEQLKDWLHHQLKNDAFNMYHGSVGNCFRTKYREYDFPFSEVGVKALHARGVHAIVHGHLSLKDGQRLVLRKNMLNIECDCALDINTRKNFGLSGEGAAVTIFSPEGRCYGISRDYPFIKCLDPKASQRTEWTSSVTQAEAHFKIRKKKAGGLMSIKGDFSCESLEDTQSVVHYLNAISEGFSKNGLVFGSEDKRITLSPNGMLKLRIDVDRRDEKVKLTLRLEWKEESEKEKKKKKKPLFIEARK